MTRTWEIIACVILHIAVWLSPVKGYPMFRDEIPNGQHVINPCNTSAIWNGVGHKNEMGGGERNVFGLAFAANGKTWNKTLCEMDPDGDGRTNGEELGDPDCTWTKGSTPSRTTNITHPGICEPLDSPTCKTKNSWLNCTTVTTFNCSAFDDPATTKTDLKFPRTEVPAKETTYICMGYSLPSDKKYHLVGSKPLVDNIKFPHHMLVYGCRSKPSAELMSGPHPCEMTVNGCLDLIAVWTVGLPGHCFPSDVGLPIGMGSFTYAILQIHWNNPSLLAGEFDSTGISLHYTTVFRPKDMAIVFMGQTYLDIPPNQSKVVATATFGPDCSRNMNNTTVDIFSGALHMHLLGRGGQVNITHNGVTSTMITDDHYDYNTPKIVDFNPRFTFQAGDSLSLKCVFDSTGRVNTTHWGEGTRDEMCYIFLFLTPPLSGLSESGQYKTTPICPLNDSLTYAGCNAPVLRQSFGAIGQTCNMSCSSQCMQSIKTMQDTNCFNLDIGGYIRDIWPVKIPSLKPIFQIADYCTAMASLMSTPAGGGSSMGPSNGPGSTNPGGPTGPGGPTMSPGGPTMGPGGTTMGPGGSSGGPGGPSGPGMGTTSSGGGNGEKKHNNTAVIVSSVVVGCVAILLVLCVAFCIPDQRRRPFGL